MQVATLVSRDEGAATAERPAREPLAWLDALKGVALAWIVLNHIVERIAGGPFAGNPDAAWPPLAARIAQFAGVGSGAGGAALTAVRDLGWFGDQGVTVFVIASGFGLAYGLLARGTGARLDRRDFYRRRLLRLYPAYWGAHVLVLASALAGVAAPSLGDWRLYASLAGLRFLPAVFYYGAPAWWYVGLALQLYLVFPFLWTVLVRRGAGTLLALGCALGFASLALELPFPHGAYLDAWQRGAVFLTRLPEFTLGMAVAARWHADPERTAAALRRPLAVAAAAAAYALGIALSFTRAGMVVAPALLGASASLLLFAALCRAKSGNAAARLGRVSYPVYLVHHPLVLALVPAVPAAGLLAAGPIAAGPLGAGPLAAGALAAGPLAAWPIAAGIAAALAATAAAAFVLQRGTDLAESATRAYVRKRGVRPLAAAVAGGLALLGAALVAADLAIEAFAPVEANGWGERPSLQRSARFGWNLRPNQTTRLRWESYDYRVTANGLGFPAPAYPASKPPGALRVMVTGDAFSSAEGVDTGAAWPRRMEADLRARLAPRRVEVLDFAITGYGPQHEAAVIETFAPRYRPDVVLVEMFVNDVGDVLIGDDAFAASIGFGAPEPGSLRTILSLADLRLFVRMRVTDPIHDFLRRRPGAIGYFLGNFTYLERDRADYDGEGMRRMTAAYQRIARAARNAGARTIVVLVPASVQVCDPAALPYYPRFVDLRDLHRFDLDLPERRAAAVTRAIHATLWDARPMLRSLAACPYVPANMHFTAAGHDAIARWLAERLAALTR